MKKTHLQCGYEDKCKKKDCLNCPLKEKKEIEFTIAEQVVIEDFTVADLNELLKDSKKLELMQKVMFKLMKKVYK